MKQLTFPSTILLVILLLGACVPIPATPAPAPTSSSAGIANPAAGNCIRQGGTLEIRDEAGGQAGYCKFADGSECEEWALMRGECKPGQPAPSTQAAVEFTASAVAPAPLGPIEALFTVDEEADMTGALGLQAGVLQNGIMINLDSEIEGEFTIGSAGGENVTISAKYAEANVPPDVAAFAVTVAGLKGGHSGMDIHRGRGHAARLLVRFLKETAGKFGVRVARITSGTADNAIPREASALIVVPNDQVDAFLTSVQGFEAIARSELAATVYQPMLELLALLQANDFKTFILSGGGVEFMRVFSEEVYGIPRERVIGSSLQYKFQQTPEGVVLVRQPELVSLDDREMKPVNIQLHIGRRPIMAIGNSDGDLAMFQYTASRKGPYLNVLVVHDDARREYEVLTGTDAIMTAAAQSPWVFASMKRDFKTVFPDAH